MARPEAHLRVAEPDRYPYLHRVRLDEGAPQNVTEALAFLLQDGEVELSTAASNRTFQFTC
jgi:hypothetical protein